MAVQVGVILAQVAPVGDRRRNQPGSMFSEQSSNDRPRDIRHPDGQPKVSLVADLSVRGLGLLAIALSAGACLWLYRLLHAGTPPAPSLGQYALATVTFLGASIGSGLLILGGHIHERVEIAERYRRRW